MPKINFELPVTVDSLTAFEKIKKFLSAENDFKKFDPKVSCTFDENDQICSIKGSQFNARIKAAALKKSAENAKNKTNVEVQIDIPFSLVLFKGKIQEIVEKNLKKVFKI